MDRKTKTCKVKKSLQFDPLDVTESLGYKTYRKNGRNSWSKQDDNELRSLLNMALVELGYVNGTDDIKSIQESEQACKKVSWEDIAARFKSSPRKPKELRKRWTSSLDPNLKRGKWAPDEDELLLKAYAKHGSHWLNVASEISGRTEDQCAKRYVEILGPSSEGRLRKWTLEEDLSLVSKVKSYGTKWRRISSELESRPSLTCRNRWRKIITSIVRGQAPPEIVKAVNENQDIDTLVNSLRAKEQEKSVSKRKSVKVEEEIEENDEQEMEDQEIDEEEFDVLKGSAQLNKGNSNDLSHAEPTIFQEQDHGFVDDDAPTNFKEEVHQSFSASLMRPFYNGSNIIIPSDPKPNGTPSIHQQEIIYPSRSSSHSAVDSNVAVSGINRSKSSSSLKDSTPFAERLNHIHPNLVRSPITSTLDGPSLIPSPYAKESSVRMGHSTVPDQRLSDANLNQNIPTTGQGSSKNCLNSNGQTDWKFTLKDGKGLSISSGSISNYDLVKELIEQAKKFSLKISLHQHIHHHYGGQNDPNSINTNSMEAITTLQPHPIAAGPAMGSSSTSNDLFTNSHYYKASFDSAGQHNDIFAQEPNYNSFDLDPSPQPNENQEFYLSGNQVHHNHSPAGYPNRPGTTSSIGSHSTGNNDESPDIGRNRVTHFNYLPATVRPQLGSSDSTRAANLSRLLNPSPNSVQSHRKKKKRTRSFPSETVAMSSTSFKQSTRPSPASTSSKHSKPSDGTGGISALYEEEGPDFWEYLRSLAGNPPSEEEKQHPHHPYEEEDYDILCSLFESKTPDVRPEPLATAVKKNSTSESDSIIPFNPS